MVEFGTDDTARLAAQPRSWDATVTTNHLWASSGICIVLCKIGLVLQLAIHASLMSTQADNKIAYQRWLSVYSRPLMLSQMIMLPATVAFVWAMCAGGVLKDPALGEDNLGAWSISFIVMASSFLLGPARVLWLGTHTTVMASADNDDESAGLCSGDKITPIAAVSVKYYAAIFLEVCHTVYFCISEKCSQVEAEV